MILSFDKESFSYALSNEFISIKEIRSRIDDFSYWKKQANQENRHILKVGKDHIPPSITNTEIKFVDKISKQNVAYSQRTKPGYLFYYLKKLEASSMLIEDNYHSKSYIRDFSKYYATCLTDYKSHCKRVHFFSISREELRKKIRSLVHCINDETLDKYEESIQGVYIGYIVVKPIPGSSIGATLLRAPDNPPFNTKINQNPSFENLNFPATRDYVVNFLGLSFKIYSLVNQSQDRATSACASISLWSVFHITGKLFQRPIPAPSEISEMAGTLFTREARIFPNTGLSQTQVGKAIEFNGLDQEMRHSFSQWKLRTLKGFIYGYLSIGLPILMGVKFNDEQSHLVTIVGFDFSHSYCLPGQAEKLRSTCGEEKISLSRISDEIQTLFCHDDQIGPYSPYLLFQKNDCRSRFTLQTPWSDTSEGKGFHQADIDSLTIAINPIIRIRYEQIIEIVLIIDALFEFLRIERVWDIHLEYSVLIKRTIVAIKNINPNFAKRILKMPMPKYVWKASVENIGKEKSLLGEFIFDAQEAPENHLLIACYIRNEELRSSLNSILNDKGVVKELTYRFGERLFDKIKTFLRLSTYL